MACGLPTVVFESEVNREILGEYGIYAEYGNAASLAKCVLATLNNKKRMSELSQRVRDMAVKSHSWNARAIQLVRIYRNLLSTLIPGKQ